MAKQDMKELGFGMNYDVNDHEEKNEKIDDKDSESPGVQNKTLVT